MLLIDLRCSPLLLGTHWFERQGEIDRLKNLFRQHPKLVSALALTTALALFFALKFLVGVAYWSQHQKETIRPWMTIGYVAKSWGLKAHEIDLRAGLPHPPERPLTLIEIAKIQNISVEDVIKHVEATVAEMKAEQK